MQIHGIDILIDGPPADAAETIIFVHGWPDTWRLWDGQVASLASSYRCVRFTLPGFERRGPVRAYSLDDMVAFIAAVADKVSTDRPVALLLHDWGCLFGYEYAMRQPERVSRIVGVDIGNATSAAFRRSLGWRAKAMIAGYQLWLAAAWAIGGRPGDRMTRWMARALRCPADPERIGAFMNFPYFIQWTGRHGSYRNNLPFEPAVPYLYLYGRRKPFMFHTAAWLDDVARRPGNRVVGVNAGHWVMCDAPDEFSHEVVSWLREGSTQPTGPG